jgi:hypothetical protein
MFISMGSCKKDSASYDKKNIQYGQSQTVTTKGASIKDYFAYRNNQKYIYEGKGNEYASYTSLPDYIVDNKVQLRIDNGGTVKVSVLECRDGEIINTLSRAECYYRENLISRAGAEGEILLKEPLIKGTKWSLKDGRKRYISNINKTVALPIGNFKAVEVTTEGYGDKTIDYYAPKLGLIKTEFIAKGLKVSSTLSKIENNAPLIQTIQFFYPDIKKNKIVHINKALKFKTNDTTRTILEKAYKASPKGDFGKVLDTRAKINSLYLGKDNTVYIDLSKDFAHGISLNASYEKIALQCMANTVGIYYGTNKVYLTMAGKPYSSKYTKMKKGEKLTVELKKSSK